MTTQNNEVDVNVLIKLYNQRLSTLTNQNVLLEAKVQTLSQDYLELQEKYNELLLSNQSEEQ
jgi:predicted nuclease with TOPRIM domain